MNHAIHPPLRKVAGIAVKTLRLVILLAVAWLAVGSQPAHAQRAITVTGSWSCNNRDVIRPVDGAHVEIWRDIWSLLPDDRLGVGVTGPDGTYSLSVQAEDDWDIYGVLVLDDGDASLENFWSADTDPRQSWSIETEDRTTEPSVVNLGTYRIEKDGGAGTPKCAIWQGGANAYRDYRDTIGSAAPFGHYTIIAEYSLPGGFICCSVPWTSLDQTHWPPGYHTSSADDYPSGSNPADYPSLIGYTTSFHEFAHAVRHSFDGNLGEFAFDVARFFYLRQHDYCDLTNEGFAFNEGWAEYWERQPPQECAGSRAEDYASIEGKVAEDLTEMEDCSDRATMVRVLRENPAFPLTQGIHSISEFRAAWERIIGRGCVAGARAPLGPPQADVAFTIKEMSDEVRADLRVFGRRTRTWGRDLRKAESKVIRKSCRAKGCVDALVSAIRPSELRVRIAQTKLLARVIRAALARTRRVGLKAGIEPRSEAQLRRDRRALIRANNSILLRGLREALADLEPAAARHTNLRDDLTRLRRFRRKIKDLQHRGKPAPREFALPPLPD